MIAHHSVWFAFAYASIAVVCALMVLILVCVWLSRGHDYFEDME